MVLETEQLLQVTKQEFLLRMSADTIQDLFVDGHLVLFTLLGHGVLFFRRVEDLSLALLGLVEFLAPIVLVIQVLRQAHSADVELGLRGDHVDLVDAAERAAVHVERSRDEQQPRWQLLEEHNTLSLVSAGEQNEHCARADAAPELVLVLSYVLLAVSQLASPLLGGHGLGHLAGSHDALAAVVVALDLLLHHLGHHGLLSLFRALVLESEHTALVIHT